MLLVHAALLCVLAPPVAEAAPAASFEEAAARADVIVVGTVIATPALAERDPVLDEVVRRNRVRVGEYVKGEGPAEIVVATFPDHDGLPQLPPVGAEALLFLWHATAADAYLIVSATHGVRPITRDDPDHRPRVAPDLLLDDLKELVRRPTGPKDSRTHYGRPSEK